ncbi:MAG: membrane protein insertase YidC [Acidobacteriota bacterium]|nr:membrane protein insertase YidC [Acidobacteriota bacterium]
MLVTANIFQPLIFVFAHIIKFFHDSIGVSWGWSIVLLTVCVRLVLVPLAVKQYHSMRALQQHQPEMKAIQRKYKDDKQRQQEEMMKFYRENNVNPFGSCLPLVAQLPVFIGLYYMLRTKLRSYICPTVQTAYQHQYAIKNHISLKAAAGQSTPCIGPHHEHIAGAGFLFVHDITSQPTGVTLILLLVLYVGTQLASSLLMQAPGMDKRQQRLMMLIPLVMVVFIIRFPAGLIIYWITTNAWTMTQQYVIRRMMGPPPVAVTADGPGGDDDDGGSGGLGALLRGRGPRAGGDTGSSRASSPSASAPKASPRTATVPPRPPRKKKKRSGRRR